MSTAPDQRLRLDRAEALRALKVLTVPGQVTELRMLKVGYFKTVSGYFDYDRHEALIEAAAYHDANAPAVYVTMNPVTPDLLARACNRVKTGAAETSADNHIIRRRFLLLDSDPSRPSGISSTHAEHDRALSFMQKIAYELGVTRRDSLPLRSQGFSD
jgi:hypothetical protein